MSEDPKTLCLLLDHYASIGKPVADMVREVEDLLSASREGVQVKAAQLLATWRKRSSKQPLRDWLAKTLDQRRGVAIRAQAAKALAVFIEPIDAPWILDMYFMTAPTKRALSTSMAVRALLPLIQALPKNSVSERGRIESRASDVNRRRAAAFALHAASDTVGLRLLANDESPQIRTLAARLLAGVNGGA
jgi:hypothetical protein